MLMALLASFAPPEVVVSVPQAPLPSVLIHRSGWSAWTTPGRGCVVNTLEGAWFRDQEAEEWIGFDPSNPVGGRIRRVSLKGGGFEPGCLSLVKGDWCYAAKGRTLFRRRLEGKAWEAWFESPRAFLAFDVTSEEEVVLLWAEHPATKRHSWNPPSLSFRNQRIQELEARFIEMWSPLTGKKLFEVAVPEELCGLEQMANGLTFFPWVGIHDRGMFIYLENLGLAYAFDSVRRTLARLDVPWAPFDGMQLKPCLARCRPTGRNMILGDFLPGGMTLSPMAEGGFRLTYWRQPLDSDHFSDYTGTTPATRLPEQSPASMGIVGPEAVFRPGAPAVQKTFESAEWKPGRAAVRSLRLPPSALNPNDPSRWEASSEADAMAAFFIGQGAYLGDEGELQTMKSFLERLRQMEKARRSRAVPPVADPAGTPSLQGRASGNTKAPGA